MPKIFFLYLFCCYSLLYNLKGLPVEYGNMTYFTLIYLCPYFKDYLANVSITLVNKDILKDDYQKPIKTLTLIFLSNPVSFNGQSYQKQKKPGTRVTCRSSGYKTSSQKFIY